MSRISTRQICRFKPKIFSFRFSSISDDGNSISHYHPYLKLLSKSTNTQQLFQIQSQFIISGLFRNPSYAIKILKRASQFSDIDYTISIFRNVDKLYCVNTMIKAYSVSSIPQQAVVFYFEMLRKGFLPDSYTYVWLFSSCSYIGCIGSGLKCHGQAIKNGVDNVIPVQNTLIRMYSRCKAVDLATKVFDEMSTRDIASWNVMVDGYARKGDLDSAHYLFDAMSETNVISFNTIIKAYLKSGNPGCALKLFREMEKNTRLKGNDITMVYAITACGRSGRLKEGKSVHGSIVKKVLSNSNIIIETALIDMYCKCKKVELARCIFDKITYRNRVCWNAMILGYSIHGNNPEYGLTLYEEMTALCKEQAICPDEITFVGVFCACVRLGLLSEGKEYYYNQMVNVFGIKPNFAHVWCMANLYAGSGFVKEAEEIIRNISVDEDEDISSESLVWANLLCSSRFGQDFSFGEEFVKSLIEKEPGNFSYYWLLLNVYAVAGRWKDVAKMKNVVKEMKFRRIPGCGLVDLKNIVHQLKVGCEKR